MGKTKKTKPSDVGAKVPLEQAIYDTKFVKAKNKNKIRLRQDEEEQVFLVALTFRETLYAKINFSMSAQIYPRKFCLLPDSNSVNLIVTQNWANQVAPSPLSS